MPTKRFLSCRKALLAAFLSLSTGSGCLLAHAADTVQNAPAPKPLYRDPIHDGAADPSLVWNRAENAWTMFYTNRRAEMTMANPKNVSWVHGTAIGIAKSNDGAHWKYSGTVKIPYGKPDYTYWAPDVIWDRGLYHM